MREAHQDLAAEIRASRLRLAGVAILCAKVALVPLVFDQGADFAFVVPKALLSHSLAFLLTGVVAGLIVRFGRAFIIGSWLHIPVLAFLGASAAATLVAADLPLALYGTHARMLGLATIADWVVLYFAAVFLARTRWEAIAVVASVFGAAGVVLAYEAIQFAGRDPFRWNVDSASRPFSTLGNATMLAQYLTALAIGGLALGVSALDSNRLVRAGALLAFVALLIGAAATGTRSILVGIAAGGLVLVVLIWFVDTSKRARGLSLITGLTVAAALAGLFTLTSLGSRSLVVVQTAASEAENEDLASRLEPSSGARVALYTTALEMVRDRPVLGYGPDNFPVGFARFRTDNEPSEIRLSLPSSAHSWVAYIGTGSGLVGLACFVAIGFVALGLTLRSRFHPLALVAAATLAAWAGTGLTTVTEVDTDWVPWLCAGAIAAVTARPKFSGATSPVSAPPHRGKRTESVAKRVAAAAFVGAGLVLAVTSVRALEASRLGRQGTEARLVGTSQAIDLAMRATQADPGRAEYWHYLGLAYVAVARWPEASNSFERASRLAPYEAQHIGDYARAQLVLARAGDAKARATALALADQVVKVDPNRPDSQLTRAVVMQVLGNLPEANRAVDRAFVLNPESTDLKLYVTATQIKIDLGRGTEAVDVARRGLKVFGRSPASIDLRYELARALFLVNKPLEALTELEVAQSIQPTDRVEQLRTQIRAALGQP